MAFLRRTALFLAGVALLSSCHRDPSPDAASKAATKKAYEALKARLEARSARQPKAAPPAGDQARDASPDLVQAGSGTAAAPSHVPEPHAEAKTDDFIADEAVTLGVRGPATATPLGVVLFTRDNDLVLAPLGKLSTGRTTAKSPIRPFPAGSFHLSFGPSLFQGNAYWIAQGRLVRRKVGAREQGPLEVLTSDAHDGTRVAVPIAAPDTPEAKMPATVAYIVKPKQEGEPLLASLWVEGFPPEGLTAEGNSTHSVSLVRTDDGVLALSVQARMAMTPVHARRIRFVSGRPLVGDDLVVWVGGGIQPLTEMTILPGIGNGNELWGFIPHERTMRDFGLARLALTRAPTMDTKVDWLLYPNGIDPAPVAATDVCGFPAIAYAAPSTRDPDAPQDLWVRKAADLAAPALNVGRAKVIYFVSMVKLDGGALVVWVTDSATMAATVRCTRRAK
jgi:hypothetical protein